MKTIDLNSDLGEGYGAWRAGDDAAMLRIVTSANIACGGHAGDPETMFETLRLAKAGNVMIGAHPGYADREGFGRRIIPSTIGEIERLIATQVGALIGVAALAGAEVRYVKPHGALGNLAADDNSVAEAIINAVKAVSPQLAILAISGTELEQAAKNQNLVTFSEIFADRGYLPNGRLVPRSKPGAMIDDAHQAADRLIGFLASGMMPTVDGPDIALAAHSICVHGDSEGAITVARVIRERLTAKNVTLAPFLEQAH